MEHNLPINELLNEVNDKPSSINLSMYPTMVQPPINQQIYHQPPTSQPINQQTNQPMYPPIYQQPIQYQAQQPPNIQFSCGAPPVGPKPTTIVCPMCQRNVTTRVRHKATIKTHLIVAILCLFFCWPCAWVPYFLNSCRDANHFCPSCNAYIGTYKH